MQPQRNLRHVGRGAATRARRLTGTWCGTRAIASLVSGVLGSAAFVTGAKSTLFAVLVTGYSAPTAGASAMLFGGLLGIVGGAVLVGIGVVTLAYTSYVCATE